MQLQRRYARVALDNLHSPVLRHVLRVWDEKRSGRAYPARDDLRPHDFAPHLRHLSLARVIEGSGDFELRIIGDAIVQAYGENFTGRTLSSIAEFVGDAVVAAYHSVVLEGEPIVLYGSFERPRNHHFRRELILLPLGTNGRVEFVLSAGMLMPRADKDLADCVAA
ncbi:MAG TPA: PAS domain-containing protein [Rhizomicrobium sp.]|nr:PAS domain-containing protein [Rhizomicrobium sp.]